jgi:hypothetical protein
MPFDMAVSSKTPIGKSTYRSHSTKKSSKSSANNRNAAVAGALDEYTRSMREYLDHSDFKPDTSREGSPEFCWRELNELPKVELASASGTDNAASIDRRHSHDSYTSQQNYQHNHDHYQIRQYENKKTISETSDDDQIDKSLSRKVSSLRIGSGAVKKSSSKKYCVN